MCIFMTVNDEIISVKYKNMVKINTKGNSSVITQLLSASIFGLHAISTPASEWFLTKQNNFFLISFEESLSSQHHGMLRVGLLFCKRM